MFYEGRVTVLRIFLCREAPREGKYFLPFKGSIGQHVPGIKWVNHVWYIIGTWTPKRPLSFESDLLITPWGIKLLLVGMRGFEPPTP
jgi:hypothetical protein